MTHVLSRIESAFQTAIKNDVDNIRVQSDRNDVDNPKVGSPTAIVTIESDERSADGTLGSVAYETSVIVQIASMDSVADFLDLSSSISDAIISITSEPIHIRLENQSQETYSDQSGDTHVSGLTFIVYSQRDSDTRFKGETE